METGRTCTMYMYTCTQTMMVVSKFQHYGLNFPTQNGKSTSFWKSNSSIFIFFLAAPGICVCVYTLIFVFLFNSSQTINIGNVVFEKMLLKIETFCLLRLSN